MITSNQKKKILVITGTRAEYGILRPIIDEILKSKRLELRLIVTGMHILKKYGLTINEIRRDKVPIAVVVKISENDDMLIVLSKEIIGIKNYCQRTKPDLILILGDRGEQLAGAIVGGHLNIPIVHIRGGEISGYVVDSSIRDAITRFARLHFVISEKSYQRLVGMGEEKWRVFRVGATEFDIFSKMKFLTKKTLAKTFNLDAGKKWFLVVHHPASLDTVPFLSQIRPLFKFLSQNKQIQKIVIYPNSDTGSDVFIREINRYRNNKDFFIVKNLPRGEYINIFKNADLLIGNSSSGIVESAYLKLPTINIGNRQRGREKGENVIDCNYDYGSIRGAVKKTASKAFIKKCGRMKSPYIIEKDPARKVLTIIKRFINISNKQKIFKKEFIHV